MASMQFPNDYLLKLDPYSSHSILLRMVPPGSKVLDVGCWKGKFGEMLKKKGCSVTGIEECSDAAAEAKKVLDKVYVSNIENYAFKDKYDVIVFGDVLEHLKKPEEVLKNALKALKPEGKILISVPNVAHWYVRFQLLLGKFDYDERGLMDKTHMRWFTRKTLFRMINGCGLDIREFSVTPIPLPLVSSIFDVGQPGYFFHKINAFVTKLWKNLFAYQFIVCASPKKAVGY